MTLSLHHVYAILPYVAESSIDPLAGSAVAIRLRSGVDPPSDLTAAALSVVSDATREEVRGLGLGLGLG